MAFMWSGPEDIELSRSPWTNLDGPELAAAAAALQLVEDNIPRLVRLQRLAAIGASLPSRPDGDPITPSLLRKLLRRPQVADATAQEDPYDDIYVDEVAFFDGPFRVIQGLTNRSAHTINLILLTIFSKDSRLPEQLKSRVAAVTRFALSISEMICASADLKRGVAPATRPQEDIRIPGRSNLTSLVSALTFELTDLESRHLEPPASWITTPGAHSLALEEGGTDDGLIMTPLLAAGSQLIVINPGELAARLRHEILLLTRAFDCTQLFVDEFRQAVLSKAQDCLRLMDAHPTGPWSVEADGMLLRQEFKSDAGILIDLAVCTDNLESFDPAAPFGEWSQNVGAVIQSVVDDPATEPRASDSRTLRLGITDGFARSSFIGMRANAKPGPLLVLPLDELQVLTELDGGDPLFLWYFALANERLHDDVQVLAWAPIDLYAIYRANERSFYLSDGPKATHLSVVAGEGLPLRVEAQRRVDRHTVQTPYGGGYAEVIALYSRDDAPIYFVHPRHRIRSVVVETSAGSIWTHPSEVTEVAVANLLSELCEPVAFWIWQINERFPADLFAETNVEYPVVFSIDVKDQSAWSTALAGGLPSDSTEPWVTVEKVRSNAFKVTLLNPADPRLEASDNSADRHLVRALTAALLGISTADARCELFVDSIAPRGHKKMFHILRVSNVQLRPARRRPALVSSAVTARLLDELGLHLCPSDDDSELPVPDDERTKVLNDAVDYYFQRLVADFAKLSPVGLIDFLIRNDEGLLALSARREWLLPAQLACFGSESVKSKELLEDQNEQTAASVASRFLVEYAAATETHGDVTIDRVVYDQLLAIASELISRAQISDAIRYGFSDAKLTFLRSRRLGVSRGDSYTSGARAVMEAASEARHGNALAGTPKEDVAVSAPAIPAPQIEAIIAKVDQAMVEEFGLSMTQLFKGLYEVIALGDEMDAEVPTVHVDAVEARLAGQLGWSAAMSGAFISHLSLTRRSSFLAIGNDAWPWRYNRDSSYMRRPFVLIDADDGAQITWGVRRLEQCARYWHSLLFGGRMRASTGAMKVLMSTIRQDENRQFEVSVGAGLAAEGFRFVDSNIKKVAGKRLQGPRGEDLGDVDAMAYDPSRNILIVAEAKDLEMALTPFELANEVDALVTGKRSAVDRISLRAQWITNNVGLALKHLRAPSLNAEPQVVPVVVTSRTLIASKVVATEVPIVSIDELASWVSSIGSRRRRSSRPG